MIQERLEFTKRLALEAGKLTLQGHGKCGQMPKDMPDGYDIATVFDFRTEELVKQRISDRHPGWKPGLWSREKKSPSRLL